MMFDDGKDSLPTSYTTSRHRERRRRPRFLHVLALLITIGFLSPLFWYSERPKQHFTAVPFNVNGLLEKCSALKTLPSPPLDFYNRTESDRFDAALAPEKPVVIRNAKIWTGEVAEGLEIVFGDVLLEKGIIKAVGNIGSVDSDDVEEIDANGAWVTAGIVDLHSHMGDFSVPTLKGVADTNSHNGLTQPWLRSLDALNTHDEAFRLSIAGGLTSAVILPGSANAIGGQAFPIKPRPTSEKSASSMLLEPPFDAPGRWRHMKQACGENPSRMYSGTRMDTIWAFRTAYEEARKIKEKQDAFCEKVEAGRWDLLKEPFPYELKWEALVDVLRGKVKIQNHCYEAVDLDGIVRLSNEFNFSIAGFHHAHDAYLVPDLLKKTYGHPPVVALFATNARYKRESYRGSEFAPKVLSDNGIDVVMKSDHPVVNSRYLLHEAQQAHFYGFPASLALASVTTTPAKAAGLDHRIGKVKQGYDADLVIWDAHPLALGATPLQVFIDGIPQLSLSTSVHPHTSKGQEVPRTPDFEEEARETVKADGLPSLRPKETKKHFVFEGLASLYLRREGKVVQVYGKGNGDGTGRASVLVRDGHIVCVAGVDVETIIDLKACTPAEMKVMASPDDTVGLDLRGGSLAPALTVVGTDLGLAHIASEPSTGDAKAPGAQGDDVHRAIDGLMFSTRDALVAYRSGITTSITYPKTGLAAAFSTGVEHSLEKGAVLAEENALNFVISLDSAKSVSTQIHDLRKLLLGAVSGEGKGELGKAVKRVIDGEIPLLIQVNNADIMATLIKLKQEIESLLASDSSKKNKNLRVVFSSATEAHLLASEIAQADIGVIVAPTRPFPMTWESLRYVPGPPLSKETAITELLKHNVSVAIGTHGTMGVNPPSAISLRWDIAWAALDSEGTISRSDALEMASVNVERLLGLDVEEGDLNYDLVATKGGQLLEFEGKVVAVVSKRRGVVDVF